MARKRSAADALSPTRDEMNGSTKNAKRRALRPSPAPVPSAFTSESICAAARQSIGKLLAAAPSHVASTTAGRVLRSARMTHLTMDKASWIYHVPGWYKRLFEASPVQNMAYGEWFRAVWDLNPKHHDSIKMFGKDVLMPRFQQVYGQSYRFSGKLFEAEPFPELLVPALQWMQKLVVHPETNETYVKAGLVNWYAHGDHYMGPHADDESNIHANSPVFSLSLGAARRFVFTPRSKSTDTSGASRLEITLNDGDLLIMGGTTQKTHKHALPKMKHCREKRISITLRCFK